MPDRRLPGRGLPDPRLPDPRLPDGAGGSGAAAEEQAVAVFVALADPTRRAVLGELARSGSATVSDLARRLPITRQAVAKHLGQLVEAGLVHLDEPAGRRHPYRLDPAPIQVAMVWLSALATEWDHRLANLARLLDQGGGRPG